MKDRKQSTESSAPETATKSTIRTKPPQSVNTNKLERYLSHTRRYDKKHRLIDLVDIIDRGTQ